MVRVTPTAPEEPDGSSFYGSQNDLAQMARKAGPVDDSGKYGKPRQFDPEFHGPIKNRSCTDIFCLILLLAFLAGWGVIAYFAFANGNWDRLLHPTDSRGRICGKNNNGLDLTNRTVLFYFDITKCIGPQVLFQGCRTPSVCRSECPGSIWRDKLRGKAEARDLICLDDVNKDVEVELWRRPLPSIELTETRTRANHLLAQKATTQSRSFAVVGYTRNSVFLLSAAKDGLAQRRGRCASYYLPSRPIGGRCFPFPGENYLAATATNTASTFDAFGNLLNETHLNNGTQNFAKLLEARAVVEKIFQDFSATWWMILIGFGITMVISFLWIVAMRWLAAPMVWLAMVSVIGLLGYVAVMGAVVGAVVCGMACSTNVISLERFSLDLLDCLISTVYYCFTMRASLPDDPDWEFTLDLTSYMARRDTWLAFGIISGVVLGIILLIAIFLRNRIRLAIALLEEASKGVSYMMCTLLFPLIPFVLQVAVFGFWGVLAILLSSAGRETGVELDKGDTNVSVAPVRQCDFTAAEQKRAESAAPPFTSLVPGSTEVGFATWNCAKALQNRSADVECVFGDYKVESMYTYFQFYNVFGLFWLGFFVVGLSEVALAGAFASFYWTRDKSKDLPSFPLAASFGRCFRYHMGSVAFGSLILAVVRFIRWLLEQLDQKLKQSQMEIARFFLKCCACCLWCLEKFLKFLNRNAYIMIAIYGKNFCRSARNAFFLLMRNILRVVVLDKVTDFLLFLGKLVVVGAVGAGSYFFFHKKIPNLEHFVPVLNYFYVPVITVIVGSYLIASAFFGVYAMAVDTLFLCFLEDLERNDGTLEKPYFMSKNLMRILGKKNKKPKKVKEATTAA